ncbi:MAG: hypothetical protein P8L44_16685 [Opitutales bacterium]|jgi:hypothetical protein|nr:hypothetical protein [bacterium]MDG2169551.1 hypothetical protein [Opitutales bacterium]
MPKVIATAEVEDIEKWEAGFATHGDLFKAQTIANPISYLTDPESNQIILCFEPDDLDTFFEVLEKPEAAEAMAQDGVKRETVKFFVLNKSATF